MLWHKQLIGLNSDCSELGLERLKQLTLPNSDLAAGHMARTDLPNAGLVAALQQISSISHRYSYIHLISLLWHILSFVAISFYLYMEQIVNEHRS